MRIRVKCKRLGANMCPFVLISIACSIVTLDLAEPTGALLGRGNYFALCLHLARYYPSV